MTGTVWTSGSARASSKDWVHDLSAGLESSAMYKLAVISAGRSYIVAVGFLCISARFVDTRWNMRRVYICLSKSL